MNKYEVGDRVKITSDNENYADYIGDVLIIESIATSTAEHPGYDEGVGGQLMDFVGVPFSLYAWEVKLAKQLTRSV